MGQRANLILVEAGEYHLYYSHWCANTLPRDLFWGPEHAIAFVRLQRLVDESGWLDEVWAEGGAVVDIDRRHLLLYGGEDVLHEVPLRRVYLELLERAWNGWTVTWAYEGIAALADYVRYGRKNVLRSEQDETENITLTPPGEQDWTDLVVSVRFEERDLRLYPLAGIPEDYLLFGSPLVERLRAEKGLPHFHFDGQADSFPSAGIHLDLPARQLDFWLANDSPEILNRARRVWPDWVTQWHFDRYEMQLKLAEGLLRFPCPGRDLLLRRCREMLLVETGRSGVDAIQEFSNRERAQGNDVEINPFALRDDRLAISLEKRRNILSRAMGDKQQAH